MHAENPSKAKVAFVAAKLKLAGFLERLGDGLFDRSLDTAGLAIEPEHADPNRRVYLPSGWRVLPKALRYLGVSGTDTFVDFGCGKGRVIHQAAKHPFRRVIGVEISPHLAEAARAGVVAHKDSYRCRDVEIVTADVTEFPVPDDLTVAYIFHSFDNETFESILAGITQSLDRRPRRLRLIYVCPTAREQVLATRRFRVLTEQQGLLGSPMSQVTIFESLSPARQ